MGRRKGVAGSQRTFHISVRMKPDFKTGVQAKLAWLKAQPGFEKATMGTLFRIALFEYCKYREDPRTP